MEEIHITLAAAADDRWARVPFVLPASISLHSAGDLRRDSPNRLGYYAERGVAPQDVCVVRQMHSRHVVVIDDALLETAPRTATGERLVGEAGGMLTSRNDVVLAVTVADCMPIWLYDEASGARGLLHSGWRGTGILQEALATMCSTYGTAPERLIVALGPCISVDAYEVDRERAEQFAAEWGSDAVRWTGDRPFLDLRSVNVSICRRAGVDVVSVIDHCTVGDTRFGSFRREGAQHYTLMLALHGNGRVLETLHETGDEQ